MTQPADASPPAPAEIPWHHLVEETSDESALSATAGDWGRCGASLAQLGVNLAGVALAGTVTLWVARERAREQLSAAGRPAREA